MNIGKLLTLIGLALNTIASVIVLYPQINTKKNVDDDYILTMDKKGNYTQKKHLKDKKIGIAGFSLFALGFIIQIIGVLLG